jgi:hypothetical protein
MLELQGCSAHAGILFTIPSAVTVPAAKEEQAAAVNGRCLLRSHENASFKEHRGNRSH